MGQRPPGLKAPAYLAKSKPVPIPAPAPPPGETDDPLRRDPTRYGDWELKGMAIDF